MQIWNTELAHSLGLSAHRRYGVKQLQEHKHELEPKVTPTKITSKSAITENTTSFPAEKAADVIVLDSVPISMLPPRKRLKASQMEHGVGNTDVGITEVDKSGYAEERYDGVDFGTLLESEQFSSDIQSDIGDCRTVSFGHEFIAGSGTVALAVSSGKVAVEDSNSAERDPFTTLSTPPHRIQQESVQSGGKPRQKKFTANPQPESVWTVRNDSGDFGVVPPPTSMVAVPTPDVIQIPADAKVFQTEDGMVIVVQSDGTVQIHGHTEGQPIPIDTIRSLLGMDATGDHTLFAVGDQSTQELSQYNQSAPVTTGYELVNQISASNAISVDAGQQLLMDGSQTLMAYDPITQSVVHIDPRQTFVTLADGNTLIAVDGTQPVLAMDSKQQGIIGSSTLVQLLPTSDKQ